MNKLRSKILALGGIFAAVSTFAVIAQTSSPGKTRTIEVSGACLTPRPLPLHVQVAPDKFEPLEWGSHMFAAPRELRVVDNELLIYLESEQVDPESGIPTVHYSEAIRLSIPEKKQNFLAVVWSGQTSLEGRVIDAAKATFPMESFYVLNQSGGLLAARISGSTTKLQPGEAHLFQGKADYSSNDGPVMMDETGAANSKYSVNPV